MNKILIIGGNGFLGENLVKICVASKDYCVSVFDISKPKNNLTGVNYFCGSIEDTSYISDIIEKDEINTVIHMVSTILPGASIEQYINNCRIVQLSTIPIIDICANKHIRFVYFSSGGTVYGIKGGLISENELTAPISYYGLSKVQIEELINFYHRRYGLEYLILRPSNPYGPGQNLYGKQGLIAVILGHIINGTPIKIYGDGNIIRDYIYIDDFVYYVKELISLNIRNETINIGSGVGLSINQIINVVRDVVGEKFDVQYLESRKDDVPKIILDTTRLHNFVHHENLSIVSGVKKFYNYIK